MTNTLRFIIFFSLYTALIAVSCGYIFQNNLLPRPSLWQEIGAGLYVLTVLPGIFVLRRMRSDVRNFTSAYLLTLVIRLLLAGIFVLIVIYRDAQDATANAAYFIAIYFLLTLAEVAYLFRALQQTTPQKDR